MEIYFLNDTPRILFIDPRRIAGRKNASIVEFGGVKYHTADALTYVEALECIKHSALNLKRNDEALNNQYFAAVMQYALQCIDTSRGDALGLLLTPFDEWFDLLTDWCPATIPEIYK